MTNKLEIVFFDAAGTLFSVRGSVGQIYSRGARRFGVITDPEEVEAAFRAAYQAKSLEGLPPGQAGLSAEKAWWMDVVRRVFGEKMKPAVLSDYFGEIFETFRGGSAWELYSDTRACLQQLRSGGYRLAVISNFDSRLFDVLANLEIDSFFERVILSWHAGAAKPDPAIFRNALTAMHVAAARSLHVGDSLHEDVTGARAAGIPVVLLDREGKHRDWNEGSRLESLLELSQILP